MLLRCVIAFALGSIHISEVPRFSKCTVKMLNLTSAYSGAIHTKIKNAISTATNCANQITQKKYRIIFFGGGCVAWLQDCNAFRCHWNEWHLNTLMFNFNSTFWNCGQNHGTSKRRCVNRASGSPVVSEVHPIGALKTCTSFVMNPQASIWAEMYLPSMPQHDFVCSWTACIRATRGLFFHVVSEKQMKLLQTIAHI